MYTYMYMYMCIYAALYGGEPRGGGRRGGRGGGRWLRGAFRRDLSARRPLRAGRSGRAGTLRKQGDSTHRRQQFTWYRPVFLESLHEFGGSWGFFGAGPAVAAGPQGGSSCKLKNLLLATVSASFSGLALRSPVRPLRPPRKLCSFAFRIHTLRISSLLALAVSLHLL